MAGKIFPEKLVFPTLSNRPALGNAASGVRSDDHATRYDAVPCRLGLESYTIPRLVEPMRLPRCLEHAGDRLAARFFAASIAGHPPRRAPLSMCHRGENRGRCRGAVGA